MNFELPLLKIGDKVKTHHGAKGIIIGKYTEPNEWTVQMEYYDKGFNGEVLQKAIETYRTTELTKI